MYRILCYGLLLLVVAAITYAWSVGIDDHGSVDSVCSFRRTLRWDILQAAKNATLSGSYADKTIF